MARGALREAWVLVRAFGTTLRASRLYGEGIRAHESGDMQGAYDSARGVVQLVRAHPVGRESPPLVALMLTSTVLLDKSATALSRPAPIREIEEALEYGSHLDPAGPETARHLRWLEHRLDELRRRE